MNGNSGVAPPFDLLERYGRDAVSFQTLESDMRWWRDADAPSGTGAAIGFADTGRAWIAAGSPLAPVEACGRAAERFAADARAAGRRAIFVCIENLTPFRNFRALQIGQQSHLRPSAWAATLAAKPRLREQVRRARAKGVVVRRVGVDEVAPGAPLRAEIERLRDEWFATRRIEPMGFLVSVEPFHRPEAHIYLVAEFEGRPVQFLSAVPIYAERSWLVEDRLRSTDAPNGTTELLLDHLMREVGDAPRITPGLTPLSGNLTWWLWLARFATRPLYDFAGLERFRARLSPVRWDPIWLVWDRGSAPLVIVDLLTAFARGRLLRFAWRSLVGHPSGPPWALGLPLIPWTLLLLALCLLGQAHLLAFSTSTLAAWVILDSILAVLLFRAAMTPRAARIGAAALWALIDAVLSIQHLTQAGLHTGPLGNVLLLTATLAPIAGSAALIWAWKKSKIADRRLQIDCRSKIED